MKQFFLALAVSTLFFSCLKKVEKDCNYDPCAISASASEISDLEAYLSNNGITATKHCSGMYYSISAAGSGTTANICSTVSVTYKGMLTNGNIFDQSTTPVNFQLGGLIESWKKGIPLIKPGGKIKLYCPPSLAYGSQEIRNSAGVVVVPANSILVFEIELVSVSN
jgi:FKBP-type peptidyl-prolyl cis-trans isomerase FkpA